MLLKLLSKVFIFEQGTAIAVSWDAVAEGAMDAWNGPRPCPVTNDEIELSGVNRAGEYQLIAGDLTVQRKGDRISFPIAMLSRQLNITDEDLKNGNASLAIDAPSVFKVTVLDHGLQPIPDRRLTFYADAAATPGPFRQHWREVGRERHLLFSREQPL